MASVAKLSQRFFFFMWREGKEKCLRFAASETDPGNCTPSEKGKTNPWIQSWVLEKINRFKKSSRKAKKRPRRNCWHLCALCFPSGPIRPSFLPIFARRWTDCPFFHSRLVPTGIIVSPSDIGGTVSRSTRFYTYVDGDLGRWKKMTPGEYWKINRFPLKKIWYVE